MEHYEDKSLFSVEGITDSDRALHTPSGFAKKNLFYVQEAGSLKSLTPHWCERENVESYLFLYVKSGEGILKADNGTDYLIKKGDCAWVDCRTKYSHCSSDEHPWELIWVHFDGAQTKAYFDFFRQVNQTPVFHMAAADADEVRQLLDRIIGVQKLKDVYGEFRSSMLLTQLMTTIVLEMKKKEQKASQEFFEGIRTYISENYTNDNLIHEIESRFASDDFDIQAEFEKRYGLALWDYILNRKFTVAKELLRFSIKPVSQIVEESGIRNTDLFYQLFKENESMSPEEYRKKWAQWIK